MSKNKNPENLTSLALDLEAELKEKAYAYIKIGADVMLAKAQSWRAEKDPKGGALINRRYKGKDGGTKRQSLSKERAREYGLDNASLEAAEEFVVRLNGCVRTLRARAEHKIIKLAWIDSKVIKDFANAYANRMVEEETQADIVRTLEQHLLPFWESKPETDPSHWHLHKEEFANHILKTFTSASRAKKARYFWVLFVRFLAATYPKQISEWDWQDKLHDGRIEKFYKSDEDDDTGQDDDLKGVYIPNEDFQNLVGLLDRIIAGKEKSKIKDVTNVKNLRSCLMIGRHLGPRRNEILGLIGEKKKPTKQKRLAKSSRSNGNVEASPAEIEPEKKRIVVFNDHLLVNLQLQNWKSDDPLKRPKHGKVRRVSFFFVTPKVLTEWISDLRQWTENQADHYLSSIMNLALEKKLIRQTYKWHDLRRTFLTDAYRFHDRILVQKSAGHGSSSVTDRYLRDIRNLSSEAYDPSKPVPKASKVTPEYWFDGKLKKGLPPLADTSLNLSAELQAKLDLVADLDPEQLKAIKTLLGGIEAVKKVS